MTDIAIKRPFAVYVSPNEEGIWMAHILGANLDTVAFGDTPQEAMDSAYNVICILTGYCPSSTDKHTMVPFTDDRERTGQECSGCHVREYGRQDHHDHTV